MDALTQLAIEAACTKTLNRYAVAAGECDLDGFAGCFAEDGIWQRPGTPEMRGRAEIRTFMQRPDLPQRFRHVNGTVVIDVIDADTAKGISYTQVYNAPPGFAGEVIPMFGPDYIVEYRDQFKRCDTQWLIARRDTSVVFRAINTAASLPGVAEVNVETPRRS